VASDDLFCLYTGKRGKRFSPAPSGSYFRANGLKSQMSDGRRSKAIQTSSYSGNDQPLTWVDQVDIADVVGHCDGLYRDAMLEGNAEQVFPSLDHVSARWRGRRRFLGGNDQPLAYSDDVGVDDSVGGGNSLISHSVVQGNAEQVLPRLHDVRCCA